jgi:hypothetical protein
VQFLNNQQEEKEATQSEGGAVQSSYKKFDGGVGEKEKLLVVHDPEESKSKFLYENFTDICSNLLSASPGTILRKGGKIKKQ